MKNNFMESLLVALGIRDFEDDEELDDEIRDAQRQLADQERRVKLYEELRIRRGLSR